MTEIGKPLRRITVIPLTEPTQAPESPFHEPHKPPPKPIPHSGIIAGELTGYRVWRIENNNKLCSLIRHLVWEPSETIKGDINEPIYNYININTQEPILGGVYSFDTSEGCEDEWKFLLNRFRLHNIILPDFCLYFGLAMGRVKLWGEVVQHQQGYRASFAKPIAIDKVYGSADTNLLLRQNYGL